MRDAGVGETIYSTFPWRRDVIVRPRGADVKMVGPDGRAPKFAAASDRQRRLDRYLVAACREGLTLACRRDVGFRLASATYARVSA